MGHRIRAAIVCIAVALPLMLADDALAAKRKRFFVTITGTHTGVDTIAGTITPNSGIPARCYAGRQVRIYEDDKVTLLATGPSNPDGTYSVTHAAIEENNQEYVAVRRIHWRKKARICMPANVFVPPI